MPDPAATTLRPAREGLTDRYRRFLPITEATPIVSLGEGFTPLVRLERLGASLGLRQLYAKIEGANPTGSFKDRGMVVAVGKAMEAGATAVVCASTGNTSASAAAYGARAGLDVVVVLPRGQIAVGKLLQALVAGAKVVAVDGNFDQALAVVRELAEQDSHPLTLVNSVNPFRLEGQKTAAFEICDDLGRNPDVLAIPVGNAGNISACWTGFRDYRAAGLVESLPRMWGFQAAGAAPIVLGHPVEAPETIATAIRIGNPASWAKATAARDESGGRIDAVTDDEILAAYRDLARLEGVFCEPSSAASLAGVRKAAVAGELAPDAVVVCILTGNGLKDPKTAEASVGPLLEAPATLDGVMEVLGVVNHWLAELDGRRIAVEVPATSANLGAGYDCLGVALDLVDRIEVEVLGWARAGVDLAVDGEGADELPATVQNRFVQGLEAALRAGRGELPEGIGWRVEMTNRIPLARGLGSSAAATVGGLVAGNTLLGGPLRTPELLRLATAIEGHPDNAAAALLGGFVVVGSTDDGLEAIHFDAPRDLRAVLFIPERRLSTSEMRDVLPERVPLADAAANLGRVALGVAGLAAGRVDLLRWLTMDSLHERYRAEIYPELPRLVEAARKAGALGACLSGSGSTVIAFAGRVAGLSRIEAAFSAVAADADLPGRVEIVAPRNAGATVVAGG